MSESRWTAYDTIVSYMSTALNSLANSTNVLGDAIDFTTSGTDRKLFVDGEVYLAAVDWSAQTNPAIYLWLLRRTDGTNFEDGASTTDPARQPDAIVPLRASSAAQRLSFNMMLTNPDQGKILVGNRTGAALASSGNTVKYNIYSVESV